MTSVVHYSDREIPLITECERDCVVVTVEAWCKWYTLHVIEPNGVVRKLYYDDLPALDGEPSWGPHTPYKASGTREACEAAQRLLHPPEWEAAQEWRRRCYEATGEPVF